MAVQPDLSYYYRQNEGTQNLSPTLQSSGVWTPLQVPQRPTTSPERYHEYLSSTPVILRLPWGRERDYGGIGTVSLPADHRPKTEPPQQEAKGHKHFGYGGDPWPRGLPIQQNYNLTKLKKSAVRVSDDLYPKPPAASISDKQICENFPAEHPYHSHISKFAVFPSFTPSDEPSRCPTPLHPQTPASGYPTVILRKTKGNPYRHEMVTITSDAQKLPLTWPGQQGYYHLPKSHHENVQIYYPIPPKSVAPNAQQKSYEERLSERSMHLQRNLMRSQWLTSYNRSFTGNGEMNPLQLDDFHENVIGNITGRAEGNTDMKPTFLSTVLHARPLEGRMARLRDDRRFNGKENGWNDLESEIVDYADKKCVTDSQSSCNHNVNSDGSTEKKNSYQLHLKGQHKEGDGHKITDTEQSEALYRRQLTPFLTPCVLEPKSVYNDKYQTIGQDLYLGFKSPYTLSKHLKQNDYTLQTQGTTNNHGKTLLRPSLQDLQESFSRSEAHKDFHKLFAEKEKDLRENYSSGKRYKFYGLHSFYFHN
ncbi:sperm-associated microtubule inner protein 4 [Rhinoderma darwinii]|uniref:sperm-associated microtubule inner protein 4 n=1 Tax=Rhinoderma darwinii TaxID=43563 RepID=UPI003F6722DA